MTPSADIGTTRRRHLMRRAGLHLVHATPLDEPSAVRVEWWQAPGRVETQFITTENDMLLVPLAAMASAGEKPIGAPGIANGFALRRRGTVYRYAALEATAWLELHLCPRLVADTARDLYGVAVQGVELRDDRVDERDPILLGLIGSYADRTLGRVHPDSGENAALAIALVARLVEHHSSLSAPAARGRARALAAWELRRLREVVLAPRPTAPRVRDLADTLDLSTIQMARSLKLTLGVSPGRLLRTQRDRRDQACQLSSLDLCQMIDSVRYELEGRRSRGFRHERGKGTPRQLRTD